MMVINACNPRVGRVNTSRLLGLPGLSHWASSRVLRDLVSKTQDAWLPRNDTGGCPLAPTCALTHLHAHTCVHTHAGTFTQPCAPTYTHSETKADKPNPVLSWRRGSVAAFWDKKKNGRKNTRTALSGKETAESLDRW